VGTIRRWWDRRILRRRHATVRGLPDTRGPEARISRACGQRARLGWNHSPLGVRSRRPHAVLRPRRLAGHGLALAMVPLPGYETSRYPG